MKLYCYLSNNKHTENLLTAFAKTCGAEILDKHAPLPNDGVPVFRSRSKKVYRTIKQCWDEKRPFIFIDTGYFLNRPKTYHRFTIGHFQEWKFYHRPSDRWKHCKEQGAFLKPWQRGGEKILVCPPSHKSMHLYEFDADSWTENTLTQLKEYTDKEIIVRTKPTLDERKEGNTMESVLNSGEIHAVVTFQSGSAIDAVVNGVPVFVDKYNAAAPVGSTNLSQIEDPIYHAHTDLWAENLAYSQFSGEEIMNGTAWEILIQHPRWSEYAL